ncbi:MAG: hypothetical protein RLZZ154_525, partial [Actinomycetota bacterium]
GMQESLSLQGAAIFAAKMLVPTILARLKLLMKQLN